MDQYQTKQAAALEAVEMLKGTEAIFIKASDIHKIINAAGGVNSDL